MGKFIVKKTNTGIKFDLKAGNGEIIASSEIYSGEAACKNGIESVRVNSAAEIEDQTVEGFETPSSKYISTRPVSTVSASRQRTARSSPSARATRLWPAA